MMTKYDTTEWCPFPELREVNLEMWKKIWIEMKLKMPNIKWPNIKKLAI